MKKRFVVLVLIAMAVLGSFRLGAALAADPKLDQAEDSLTLADNLLQGASTFGTDVRTQRTFDARVAAARDLIARAKGQIELAKQAADSAPHP